MAFSELEPKPQKPEIGIDEMLIRNLKTLTGMAKTPDHWTSSVVFLAPADNPQYSGSDSRFTSPITFSLAGDCDPVNRAMLTKLYELSHVDMDNVGHKANDTTAQDGTRLYRREVRYTSDHGLSFTEIFATVGEWQCFDVNIEQVDPEIVTPDTQLTRA